LIWADSLLTPKLISRSPTAMLWSIGIRSLVEFGKQ
jgi:hypothetical protein